MMLVFSILFRFYIHTCSCFFNLSHIIILIYYIYTYIYRDIDMAISDVSTSALIIYWYGCFLCILSAVIGKPLDSLRLSMGWFRFTTVPWFDIMTWLYMAWYCKQTEWDAKCKCSTPLAVFETDSPTSLFTSKYIKYGNAHGPAVLLNDLWHPSIIFGYPVVVLQWCSCATAQCS